MIATASTFAMIAIAVSVLLNLYRLWAGPDVTDRILALDGGRVAESGPHELLMRRGGIYATLMAEQARGMMSSFETAEQAGMTIIAGHLPGTGIGRIVRAAGRPYWQPL